MLSENYNKEAVDKVQKIDNYNHYRYDLEGGPHGAIHSAIGGDMGPNTSPNGKIIPPSTLHRSSDTADISDPIFFLHHAQIDRLWWLWQEESPKTRYTEFSGYKTPDQFDGTTPPPASLDDILLMNGLAQDLKVKDLMTTKNSLLCYSY
jgi:tyrosinase